MTEDQQRAVAVISRRGPAGIEFLLLADAGHNMTDVLGLILAWGATKLATRAPTQRHTYGMARSTILARNGVAPVSSTPDRSKL